MILLSNRNFAGGQLTFLNRVRLVDPVDRVLAGDDLDQVAEDFGLRPDELREGIDVVAHVGGIRRSARARLWIGENPPPGAKSPDAQHSDDPSRPSGARS